MKSVGTVGTHNTWGKQGRVRPFQAKTLFLNYSQQNEVCKSAQQIVSQARSKEKVYLLKQVFHINDPGLV